MDKAQTLVSPSPKRVGKQLRALRRKKGLSLSEVARGTGLSRRELVAYERGKVAIPESDLWVLAGACGVDASELLPPVEVPALAAAPSTIEDTITHLRSGQDDYVLNRHLNTLAALRALPPGSQVQLQDGERASMLEALGSDPSTIEKRLVDRMRISREEAARLRDLILPSAPRYSPLAVEAPAAPEDPPASDPWFGGAFEEETPTGPVDVFEELARLGEPAAPPDQDTQVGDLRAPPPQPVLVEVPVAASASAAVRAGDAPPIDVAARVDAGVWNGAPWDASASGGSGVTTGEPLPTREPQPWEPPPSAWDESWATSAEPAAPLAHPTTPTDTGPGPAPFEIVEFVDDYVARPDEPAPVPSTATTGETGGGDSLFAGDLSERGDPTTHQADPDTPGDLGPWDHEPDPAATSTGFYVDWGTSDADLEASASLWDAPGAPPVPEPDGPWDAAPASTVVFPEPGTNGWSQPDANGWSQPGPAARAGWGEPVPEPVADHDGDVAPISWRPIAEPRPEAAGSAVATTTYEVVDAVTTVDVAAAPVFAPVVAVAPEPQPEPEPVEEFVVAGSEWILGNAVPLVEVRRQGGLVMRRADERWALADVTTTPDFALEVEVDFRSGPGFGVLFRASADDAGRMSGYSFDVDPIHEGGSYLVRQWQADRELWNPIARVAASDPASMHGVLTIRVVVIDDTVHASVNGERVLAVESLKQACADRNREPANGDRVGIQAWSSSDLVIETLRVAER
jgi:transcriptional regulator with XRE-family HTH domain